MRLHPPVSEAEAAEWLLAQARAAAPLASDIALEPIVKQLAQTMAALSAFEVSDD